MNHCPHNNIDCPCTKEGCPRHGKCCECVKHHKEQPHVHFKDGSALNQDGTWKHGQGKLTNEQKQYLKQNGLFIE